MSHTLVVGAGLAGLACATWLARAGRQVTLLDATVPGGRASTDLVEGHAFDRGAHALYRRGAAARLLATLDVHPRGAAPDPAAGLLLHEGVLRALPFRPDRLLTATWMGGRAAFAAWTARVAAGLHPRGGSAQDWLAELPDGARPVATALVRLSTYTGDLDALPAPLAARQVQAALGGVTYVEGGWGRIVGALVDRARDAGVDLRPSMPARQVAPGKVHTDTATLLADQVVLAVPPHRAAALLDRAIPAPAPTEVAAWQLALRADVLEGPRFVLQTEPAVYLSNFGAVVPLGPHPVVHAIHYRPHAGAREELEAALDAAWPRWRSGRVADRFLPRMVTTAALPSVDPPRPPVRIAPGLFGCGDGWGDHGLLADAALHSARAAAHAALADVASSAA